MVKVPLHNIFVFAAHWNILHKNAGENNEHLTQQWQ